MENNHQEVPVHVSIIMDGNGRWAAERGRERVYGHMNGVESVRAVTEAAAEEGVKYLSLYAFSEENWSRPEDEVSSLMKLMMTSVKGEYGNMMRNGIRFIALGNLSRLDGSLRAAVEDLMGKTKENRTLTLIIFLSYSGRWDILNAAKKIASEVAAHPEKMAEIENMGNDEFSNYLVTGGIPDPDLIIRTSGEQRISNYLLWQGAYSEFVFTKTLWPDFRKKEFRAALQEYSHRDRRYGKIK